MDEPMTLCFDIDGVMVKTVESDYKNSKPIQDMIDIVNYFYENGCVIVLYTARGGNSGLDWREWTVDQMQMFGVKYHRLVMGKPAADHYIDDKMLTFDQVRMLKAFYRGPS